MLTEAAQCAPDALQHAKFQLFNNQCEGVACSQRQFLARQIESTTEFRIIAAEICLRFWHRPWGPLGQDEVHFLKSRLEEFGLNDLEFYDRKTDLVEAYYPIPLTDNNLRRITGTALTIGEALAPLGADASLSAKAHIYIIADNSD